jgi:hypothetical protein
MWALVESGSITATYNQPKAIQIGDIKYPKNIFEVWSKSELEAVGLYEVVYDRTNFKDKEYYVNTNETLSFASNTVTVSWGTATAKSLNDSTDDDGNVTKGLKTLHKEIIDQQAYTLLQPSDWMVVRNSESSKAIPSDWLDFRVDVRSTASDMKDKIDAVSDVDALAALYVYTDNDPNPPTRPLGEFPNPPSS